MAKRIIVYRGDITKLGTDAIVNAANPSLLGGSGVDGAIHQAAGAELLTECRKLCGCGIGQAKITAAYQLPALKIIHTVGPIWQGGQAGEAQLLADCYRNCLQLAVQHHLTTIAFPAISTGAYGYPAQEAAKIAVHTIGEFLSTNPSINKVYLVAFDQISQSIYQHLLLNDKTV
ncbi:MAG: O-acetyl-ADP-ribose deacetylase [Clostridiales bacterium]